jgi:guanine deaminase
MSGNDPTAHAEIVASACALLGAFCNCPMCPGAIYWALFRGIYYANTRAEASIGSDGEFIFGEVRAPNNRHRAAIDRPKRA